MAITQKLLRSGRYRIRDNYTRFYLKYIEPHAEEIEDGSYRFTSLESLPDWHATMGHPFENLIVNHFREILFRYCAQPTHLRMFDPFQRLAVNRRTATQEVYP